MQEISILHDHVTAFLHGQSKIFPFLRKGMQRTNILPQSSSKTPSKVMLHLLTSLKGNDVTKCASHANIDNVMLTAQGA